MQLENLTQKEYLNETSKKIKRGLYKTLITLSTAALITACSPSNLHIQEYNQIIKKQPKIYNPITRTKRTRKPTKFNIKEQNRTEQKVLENLIEQIIKKQTPSFMGSIYGEACIFKGEAFNENPRFLNISTGYNILKRNREKGVLLFPNIRFHIKGNKPEFCWDNHLDISAGIAYQKKPFIIGADVGYRKPFKEYMESFKKKSKQGNFSRVWGGYWNRFKGKSLSDSKKVPLTPGITLYGEFEANTLSENLTFDSRIEANLDILNLNGFKIGPYIAGKINFDVENYPWNRYSQISGGLKLSKSPFVAYLETGHRNSFNKGGVEGGYDAAIIGISLPLNF